METLCLSTISQWLFVLAMAYGLGSAYANEQKHFYAEVCDDILCSFQHMEFDVRNNELYVGGINRIFQLREDLRLEKYAETGPKSDSESCYPHSVCTKPMKMTDNYNKLLILDSDNDRLVACGSIKQGICDLRELGNVSRVLNEFPPSNDPRADDFVASMLPDQTTVAFVAKEGRNGAERSLYVGSPRTELDSDLISDDEQFPTIASRGMPRNNKDKTMLSSSASKETTGHLTKKELTEAGFRVNFVSAFDGDHNGYFVITYPQINDGAFNKNKVNSYISQVCMRGSDGRSTTNSYLEIPIASRTWITGRQTLLTRVIASTTAKVGSSLQMALGIETSIGFGNPDVFFASFATEGRHAGGSTLAMFPLYELDTHYYQMIKACLNGESMKHIEWLREGDISCSKINLAITPPLCSGDIYIWDVVGLYKRNETMIGYTVYESNDTIVTSVAVAKQGRHTIAFMGTQDGRLLKLKVDSKPSGNRLLKPYEEVVIDSDSSQENINWRNMGSPAILPDMRLNNDFTRLFVMSERKLLSLPLHDCQKFTSCTDCLMAGDPFCGWCTLSDKCTPSSMCAKGPNYYATSDVTNCPTLTATEPAALDISASRELIRVRTSNIPEPNGGEYKCKFGTDIETDATYRGDYVTCMSPSPSKIPSLPGKELHLPLSLNYIAIGQSKQTKIASSELTYYDCNYLSSCLKCLGSESYQCHWCVGDNSCIQKSVSCKSFPGDLYQSEECPLLSQVIDPFYIHEHKQQNVKLRVGNLNVIRMHNPKFHCKFTIEGQAPKTINGSISSLDVSCGPIEGFLPADKHESDARVDLYWGSNYLVDNPKNLNVKMYRCSHGTGDSCGKCLLLDRDLHCGWCERQKKCMLCNDCTGGTCESVSGGVYPGWLDEAQVCMHPQIMKFSPESASPMGRTTITIEGVNFGRIYNDADDRVEVEVTVSGEPCRIHREGYEESSKIICTVENVRFATSGHVQICILDFKGNCKGADYRNSSHKMFSFVNPVLTRFSPSRGLSSGGTVITCSGRNLNIGNGVAVQIGSRECMVDKSSLRENSFKCKLACDGASRTRRSHRRFHWQDKRRRSGLHHHSKRRTRRYKRAITTAEVKVDFDNEYKLYSERFGLEKEWPKDLKLRRHESIKSGGMELLVEGNSLDLAQKLVLRVSLEGHVASQVCDTAGSDPSSRICYSPAISGHPIGNYTATLIFDDCLTEGVGVIRYTADPYFHKLGDDGGNVLSHKSGPIIITGQNLCPNPVNCDRNSAVVTIGNEYFCNVSALDKDKLVCIPPAIVTGKHPVTVYIGYYSQSVGAIQMESSFPEYLKILIPIFIVMFLIIAIVAFVIWKRAGAKMEQVKEKQMKFDMMEAKVAQECREAFAELQTDMQSDLENIAMAGIPFRTRQEYIMRVLFPDPDMQEKLRSFAPATPYSGQSRFNINLRNGGRGDNHRMYNAAFDDFNQLIENKTFLIVFIHAMEKQKRFTMRDRSNFAGLLMIVLQNRLEYATRILEDLLDELIRDVIENRGNPKLLLRRSETVAEKMLTHWFSMLLHGFLQDCAGEHLFTLYRAIRAQLDKGPVDAITGFAKYSLNQDKLFRQAINYEQLTLIVRDSDLSGREVPVRVLDCDTITQAKEKIIALKYRNVAQSQHPSPDAFDLEITSDTLGGVPLSDEDNTSIVEGGWRRLNTLHHYKVADKSVVTMVPRKKNSQLNQSVNSNQPLTSRVGGMIHNGSGARLITDGGASLPRHFGGGQQDTRSSTPTQVDDGKKAFHLMKAIDSELRDGSGTGENMVSEIYFTRLLATKGTIQKFVNDLFETIFSVVQRGHALPLAIKHMYDFFDEQAERYGITDPDIVHTWKSNSLPLRFWVNLIKNPEFLFDIKKSALVDSCLSVIAGAFMDSCSTADQLLSKDSPSGKLLYAKEVQNYKNWVVNYYNEISAMDHLGPQDMQCFLRDESMAYGRGSSVNQAALTELYVYVQKYHQEVVEALDNDPKARNQRLSQKLEQLCSTMTSTV